jgi:hypothetical protein
MAGIDQTNSSTRPDYSQSGGFGGAQVRTTEPDRDRGHYRWNDDREHNAKRIE